ncbi:hypothetical protein Mal64_32840 [Pseudobythopirellula maris]|uniref:Uncharacterized protein n=1 Tax=Pseudobythopirellula maris TaxID=2527991 RepID=A0A5C5ZLN6_9BACT|nr:hypothetical protein [Pseudobythopirellula maris]TWT87741.1 hypothetical protein Mal64_32840 [Pseudobythopirellula maris]
MSHRKHSRRDYQSKSSIRQASRRNSSVGAAISRRSKPQSRRGVGSRNESLPFSPPEDWHEEPEEIKGYKVIVQPPGEEYRHAVTPAEVRDRLASLPEWFLRDLSVVQLSRMTRKKQSLPCYGMQWGGALYLYPIDESLVEHFYSPPPPNVVNEARMYGGRWDAPEPGEWTLTWTEETIRDYYLNNILIHELGHLLDERNSSYNDRERFAEWFAIEFGYRRTRDQRPQRRVRRRHAG